MLAREINDHLSFADSKMIDDQIKKLKKQLKFLESVKVALVDKPTEQIKTGDVK